MFEPLTVSVEDACTLLGVRRTLLFSLLKSQKLTRCKFGSRTVVTMASIKKLVAEPCVNA